MQQDSFLLYGANGYTGRLVARYAAQYGLRPVLAGRRAEAVALLARELGLSYRVVDLSDEPELDDVVGGHPVVLHAAGPFQYTAPQMVEACLRTGAHYLDINGDIDVFEMLKGYDAAGKERGVMIMPGVGFDVVPTDCLSLFLKKKLPDATHLKLAFATLGGGVSHGTAATMATKLGEGGAVRKEGTIVRVPLGHKGMWVDFGGRRLFFMTIPWGDVSTAYYTTGIPNIETYTGVPPSAYRLLKLQPLFNWLLRTGLVRRFVRKQIDQRPTGPSDEQRSKATSLVWGQAGNSKGETVTARLSGPEGYTLTVHASLLILRKVLSGDFKAGYQTPASVYGEDLVLEVPGMQREVGV